MKWLPITAYATRVISENSISDNFLTLVNLAYFGTENRKSRIIGYSFPLDYSYNKPTYIIGENVTYSKLGNLSKQMKSIQYNGNTYVIQLERQAARAPVLFTQSCDMMT